MTALPSTFTPQVRSLLERLEQRLSNTRFNGLRRRRILHSAYVDLVREPRQNHSGGEFRVIAAEAPQRKVELAQALARYLARERCFNLIYALNRRIGKMFIEDMPPDENHAMVLANLTFCNLDIDTISKGYRGYRPYVVERGVANFYFNPLPDLYVFSKPNLRKRNVIDVHLGVDTTLRIALDLDDYGFPPEAAVALDPKPMFEKPPFSPPYEDLYRQLFEVRTYGLAQLLEAVGAIINGSMAYDFSKMPDPRPASAYQGPTPFSREELAKQHPPRGNETLKGQCQDAGHLIRRLLLSLHPAKTLLIAELTTQARGFFHDVTLVFDTLTSRWALVNSRSPLKPYNLIPKERLPDLGRFVGSRNNSP